MTGRVLAWFSCGDASAVAAKLAVEKYGDRCEVIYCDTFAYEHPDNRRFFADVERWLGRKIKVLGSDTYRDIYDVWERRKWLISEDGAPCTTELKINVRKAYQQVDDIHVFGYTVEEQKRAEKFMAHNHELYTEWPLIANDLTKSKCHAIIKAAGIELPMMYRMGYKNNNCIGCVKGGMGYWNKIRVDYPEIFAKMAALERKLNHALLRREGKPIEGVRQFYPVFLDELNPKAGRYKSEADIECGVLCKPKQAA